jgi:hypothetical protein
MLCIDFLVKIWYNYNKGGYKMNSYELFTFNTQYIKYQDYKKQQQNDIIKSKILDLQYTMQSTQSHDIVMKCKNEIAKLQKELKY